MRYPNNKSRAEITDYINHLKFGSIVKEISIILKSIDTKTLKEQSKSLTISCPKTQ